MELTRLRQPANTSIEACDPRAAQWFPGLRLTRTVTVETAFFSSGSICTLPRTVRVATPDGAGNSPAV